MPGLAEPDGCHQYGCKREGRGGKCYGAIITARGGQHYICYDGSQNEADAEGRADQAETLRTVLLIRAVGDRGLCRGNVRAG